MTKTLPILLAAVAFATAFTQPGRLEAQGQTKLIVMIGVDQLGGDLIDRYRTALTAGGFNRFLEQGYRFTEAAHAHAMPETAAGHATVSTGVFPSRHGIVSNSWWQRVGFNWVLTYDAADTAAPILGYENDRELEGRSPKLSLREGIADWVRAADPQARTVSISKKDRAAIAMAGHTNSNVWWLLEDRGEFVTSRYYADRYPEWVATFNAQVMAGLRRRTVWESEVPQDLKNLATADSRGYELGGRSQSSFPHDGEKDIGPVGTANFNRWVFDTPRADDAVLELAKTAIAELQLGQRESVDFLAVSFSALDRVGHGYGPLSQEALSTLIHLDGVLANLMAYLDEQVGVGGWAAGLVGDHGAAVPPEAGDLAGYPDAERIDMDDVLNEMGTLLRQAATSGGSPNDIAERLAKLVVDEELAAAAYTHRQLAFGGEPADSFAVLFRNSYYPGRAWGLLSRFGVEVRFKEGDLVTSFDRGTDHGSPYRYDRHVEMMWLGPNVLPGESAEPVYTVDFAPTLAALAGIPTPEDLDGRRLF